ncbi:hypothetical protein [Atlantibacter sp.]|uniref:hypothetical protein n=1 Tax=Atlantibacter sp. TaxID=1903473 RepID=UPI00289B1C29|nr:hypothetical protein [Atlantibacter sp.]
MKITFSGFHWVLALPFVFELTSHKTGRDFLKGFSTSFQGEIKTAFCEGGFLLIPISDFLMQQSWQEEFICRCLALTAMRHPLSELAMIIRRATARAGNTKID